MPAPLFFFLCSMVFSANDSPLAGRSGKAVTGRAIGARLMQEAESSVSLRVTPLSGSTEKYEVQVRGHAVRGGGVEVASWVVCVLSATSSCGSTEEYEVQVRGHATG
jgi:hypothetical protein